MTLQVGDYVRTRYAANIWYKHSDQTHGVVEKGSLGKVVSVNYPPYGALNYGKLTSVEFLKDWFIDTSAPNYYFVQLSPLEQLALASA